MNERNSCLKKNQKIGKKDTNKKLFMQQKKNKIKIFKELFSVSTVRSKRN